MISRKLLPIDSPVRKTAFGYHRMVRNTLLGALIIASPAIPAQDNIASATNRISPQTTATPAPQADSWQQALEGVLGMPGKMMPDQVLRFEFPHLNLRPVIGKAPVRPAWSTLVMRLSCRKMMAAPW